jgi:hypothetical protein
MENAPRKSLNVVGNVQMSLAFPCNLCELYLTCIDNNGLLYRDIRSEFGSDIYHESEWEQNDVGIFSKSLKYDVMLDDNSEVPVDESHYLSLGEMINGEWNCLKLNIATHIKESAGGVDSLQTLSWELDFSVSSGTISCCVRCLSHQMTHTIADKIFNFDTLQRAMIESLTRCANDDRRMNVFAQESDELASSESWLRLVTSSSMMRSEAEPLQDPSASGEKEQEGDIEKFHEMLSSQPPTPYASGEINVDFSRDVDEDINRATSPHITPVITREKPHRTPTLSDEYIYFSMRLGINFRLQGGVVMVGSLDSTATGAGAGATSSCGVISISGISGGSGSGIADDDESCTLLSGTDIKNIRDRCCMEDSEYCSSLDIVRFNRMQASRTGQVTAVWQGVNYDTDKGVNTTACSDMSVLDHAGKPTGSSEGSVAQSSGTFAEQHGQEKLWAYGPDTVKPTYYINAAPQRVDGAPVQTSSGLSTVTITPPRAQPVGSSTSTVVTAHAVAMPPHGSSLNEDPRSPSARTPIAPVVNAVAMGPVEVCMCMLICMLNLYHDLSQYCYKSIHSNSMFTHSILQSAERRPF